MQTNAIPTRRSVEFGIYRDGDNNLDTSQANVLSQALQTSAKDASIGFNVQDTTSRDADKLRTESYTISGGNVHHANVQSAHDMASPGNLARFVAQTLDRAQASDAKQTWIDLVDHGAGDGGGLEADSAHGIMSMPSIAGAIAQGVALHAKEHPEDAGRGVDGVVANQCLMSSLGFADALSHAGVKYLAASPETMVSPGTPSDVAEAIAAHTDDPKAMARGVVGDVMHERYGIGGQTWGPAAAYDVLDLSPQKMQGVESSVKHLDDALVASAKGNPTARAQIRSDVGNVDGMVRFPQSQGLPWHADRPAMAVYGTLANDSHLSAQVRSDARTAEQAVGATVLAHGESAHFAPFGGSDYRDAVGPTAHLPTTPKQVDPWAPNVSETNNAFYHATDEDQLARVIA